MTRVGAEYILINAPKLLSAQLIPPTEVTAAWQFLTREDKK